MGQTLNLKNELQETYWKYITTKLGEYTRHNLSGRLVIDIKKGEIQQVFNQEVVAGVSNINYHLDM